VPVDWFCPFAFPVPFGDVPDEGSEFPSPWFAVGSGEGAVGSFPCDEPGVVVDLLVSEPGGGEVRVVPVGAVAGGAADDGAGVAPGRPPGAGTTGAGIVGDEAGRGEVDGADAAPVGEA
jgi:hypothetical protein